MIKMIRYKKSTENGTEAYIKKIDDGYSVIYRDVDCDELIVRKNFGGNFKGDSLKASIEYFNKLT
jgi:hypothetical protein